MLKHQTQVIGVFVDKQTAGQAFDQLIMVGFPLARVFLLEPNAQKTTETDSQGQKLFAPYQRRRVSATTIGLKKGFVLGTLSGGVIGLLVGAGILALPDVGHLGLISAIAFLLGSSVVGTAAGGVIGFMVGLSLTERQLKDHARQLEQGKYLLLMEGTPDELKRARVVLGSQEVQK